MDVFATQDFYKEVQKALSTNQKQQLETFIDRFKKGQQRGKILGPRSLREIKIQSKRVYYICKYGKVLLISASNKKNQGEKIKRIRKHLEEHLEVLKNLTT